MDGFSSKLVKHITGVTDNQLKYWVKIKLISPVRNGKAYLYTFRDIIKLKLIVSLKNNGLSLQKIRKGLKSLSEILPNEDNHLTKLVIYTNGSDMFVIERGNYFNAITRQQYFSFDTQLLKNEILYLEEKFKIKKDIPHKIKKAFV